MSDTALDVFISYCHYDGDVSYRERVFALAKRLNDEGLNCEVDQYHETTPPAEGFTRWMLNQVEAAKFVLVVCTPTYYRRFRGHEEPGVGKGGVWEGGAIIQELYDAAGKNHKFIPVGFAPHKDAEAYIPEPLRGTLYRNVSTEDGYDDLYRQLTEQPKAVKPVQGARRVLPPNP